MRKLIDAQSFSRILIVALAITVCLAGMLSGCGGRRAGQAVELGEIYLRNNDVTSARARFEEALEIDPDNARAHLGLGHCQRQQDQMSDAIASYQRAIDLNPALDDAHTSLVHALLVREQIAEANEAAAAFRSANPEKGGILQSAVWRATGRLQEAIVLLEELRDQFPASVPVRVALALDYVSNGEPEKAETELEGVLDKDPQSIQARMALIEVFRLQGKVSEIETEMRAMVAESESQLEGKPGDVALESRLQALQLQLALVLLETDKADEARSIAEPIVKGRPDWSWANFVYGSVLLELGENADALLALQTAATALPDEPMVIQRLAEARGQARPGTVARADDTPLEPAPSPLTDAVAGERDEWRTLWREARLQTLASRRAEFAGNQDTLLREVIVASALISGSRAALDAELPKLSEQSKVRQLIEAYQAGDAQALRDIIDGWEETDRDRIILRNNLTGFIYAAAGARGRALQSFFETSSEYPDNVVAFYNMATMYNAAGMHAFGAQAMRRLLQRYPDSLEGRILLYQTLRRAGMIQEAKAAAETTYGIYPDERDAVLNLAEVYLDTGEIELALTVLRGGMDVRSDDPGMALALAAGLLQAGNIAAAGDALARIPASESDQVQARELRAFAAGAGGEWDEAKASLSAVPPSDLSTGGKLLRASIAMREGRDDEARSLVSDVAGASPAMARRVFIVSRALGLTTEGDAGGAARLIELLGSDRPAMADYTVALAHMDNRFYRFAYAALDALEDRIGPEPPLVGLMFACLAAPTAGADRVDRAQRLNEKAASDPQAWLGLAAVYESAQMADEQGEAIRRAVALNSENASAWLALALYAGKMNLNDEALDAYERLLALDNQDPRVFNNYAYYLLATGTDKALALEYAEKATEHLTRDPNAIHTLGVAQLENGHLEEARVTLLRAIEMLPGDPTFLLDLGRVIMAQGEPEEGLRYVEQAIRNADQLGLAFPRRDEAEAIVAQG